MGLEPRHQCILLFGADFEAAEPQIAPPTPASIMAYHTSASMRNRPGHHGQHWRENHDFLYLPLCAAGWASHLPSWRTVQARVQRSAAALLREEAWIRKTRLVFVLMSS